MRLGIFERYAWGLEVVLGERISILTRDLMQQQLTPAQESARIDRRLSLSRTSANMKSFWSERLPA